MKGGVKIEPTKAPPEVTTVRRFGKRLNFSYKVNLGSFLYLIHSESDHHV
jgi:hypothetical protein